MNHLISILKADGSKELFEEDKLIDSLRRVGASPEVIDKVVENVEKEMWDGMPTSEIYKRAFNLVKKYNTPVAVNYSLRRALSELGPDGFPFEKYISEIFKTWGYNSITNQVVKGSCVDHEMDIVSWKEDKLVMVEAKFHNEFGIKSDLKVALYVKARFDDLKDGVFHFGGKSRKMNEGWLVTNTKFTDQAVKYGECAGLKMIGWNYPLRGNLHQIIEESRLHPLTCLTRLSNIHKKALLNEGITLCKDILGRKDLLRKLGMSSQKIAELDDEVREFCGI